MSTYWPRTQPRCLSQLRLGMIKFVHLEMVIFSINRTLLRVLYRWLKWRLSNDMVYIVKRLRAVTLFHNIFASFYCISYYPTLAVWFQYLIPFNILSLCMLFSISRISRKCYFEKVIGYIAYVVCKSIDRFIGRVPRSEKMWSTQDIDDPQW